MSDHSLSRIFVIWLIFKWSYKTFNIFNNVCTLRIFNHAIWSINYSVAVFLISSCYHISGIIKSHNCMNFIAVIYWSVHSNNIINFYIFAKKFFNVLLLNCKFIVIFHPGIITATAFFWKCTVNPSFFLIITIRHKILNSSSLLMLVAHTQDYRYILP